ncbi:acyl-CoA dehydrogenase family protein [Streptosporangium carneum]|uniref:Acyl-CoA dehydrogenase n=1 Tax=Streptosporangium carneum TaxID=47481 RepID=A0A9W6I3L9_9ACTN|nr:acyl-CoA dehydrogenase family protein [Streptosporangium carneum]GLK10354.1 acyl-CoA dehydrogenase [Streptosporangium carneum]
MSVQEHGTPPGDHGAAGDETGRRLEDLARRAAALRRELPAGAVESDAENTDTAFGMRRLWEEGLFAFCLPRRFGGVNDARPELHTEAFVKIILDIMAGDSSTGMNFVVQALSTMEVFKEGNTLPETTKRELARLILDEGVRLCASNSEAGAPGPVTARRVEGGIVVNGTKAFNTNSGGGGWANVGLALEGRKGRYHALLPLDQAGVTMKHDWDVMGQRGTHSQTIVYDEVFVPDGYHFTGNGIPPLYLSYVFLMHATIMLGPGLGAFDAALDYVRKMDRPSFPEFESATEDVLVRRRVGRCAVDLEAARAFLLQSARKIERCGPEGDTTELFVESFAVKAACIRAALTVTQEIFDLTGARSTANSYRFDRFWRNARTFATHDPTDAKEVWIGDWHLSGKEPPMAAMLRV